MTCRTFRGKLPGYLDGALSAGDRAALARHLPECAACRRELDAYVRVSAFLARNDAAPPPADLELRIRLVIANERMRASWPQRVYLRARLTLSEVFASFAVPATGGVLMSLAVFAFILQSLLVGVPLGAVPGDSPINLIQPARLQTLAPVPLPLSSSEWGHAVGSTVDLVEFTVDARGRALSYEILSGSAGRDTRRQLDQLLLFSSFRPQLSFGRPTAGGRVIVRFDEFLVRE